MLESVLVPVIRSSDGEVLARGFTDNSGTYSLQFGNDGDSRYKVEVEATYSDSIISEPRASVAELNEDIPYRFQSPEINGATAPVATQDLLIEIADCAPSRPGMGAGEEERWVQIPVSYRDLTPPSS